MGLPMASIRKITVCIVAGLFLWGCAGQDIQQNRDDAISEALEIAARGAQRSYEYRAAASRYQKLYTRRPDDIGALIGYVRNLRYAGSVKESIRAVREGIKKHGEDPSLILELGKGQLANSQISRAGKTLEKAKYMAPGNWEVYSTIAIFYDRSGRMDEAEKMYLHALKLSPGNPPVINNFALSLAQAGKLDEGILLLGKSARTRLQTMLLERICPQRRLGSGCVRIWDKMIFVRKNVYVRLTKGVEILNNL